MKFIWVRVPTLVICILNALSQLPDTKSASLKSVNSMKDSRIPQNGSLDVKLNMFHDAINEDVDSDDDDCDYWNDDEDCFDDEDEDYDYEDYEDEDQDGDKDEVKIKDDQNFNYNVVDENGKGKVDHVQSAHFDYVSESAVEEEFVDLIGLDHLLMFCMIFFPISILIICFCFYCYVFRQ